MAFDPNFLEELRARTPIASVIGRRTRLSRSGRNWKACCPFHGEKSPSFYVYDDHFHCFGCGAHGDVISFVMQSAGQSFLDAVTGLAAEAGLEMPKRDPRAEQAAARAKTLVEALEAALRSFRRRLHGPEGREGLSYLRGRGLSEATIEAFGLGWSGDGRGLADELGQQGIDAALMAEAGLMRVDEAGRPKGELFFNRIIFPIRDRRGSLISFGGRTLGDSPPKYLNGPETRLFSKRLTLFGVDRAQTALRATPAGGELIVVEGYMDVIALHQAGMSGAVAPLGTALTSEQMQALWRLSPAPALCFDGDAAGRRAAIKAAETALPLLDRDRTLRFCRLPDGEDPDSLLRNRGSPAMQSFVQAARPLSDVLFELLSEGVRPDAGPEQRAALYDRLNEAASRIANKNLSREYRATLANRFFTTFRARGGGKPGSMPNSGAPNSGAPNSGAPNSGAPNSGAMARIAFDAAAVRRERLRILSAILIAHPELLHDVEEAYRGLDMPVELAMIRETMIAWAGSFQGVSNGPDAAKFDEADEAALHLLDSQALVDHLQSSGLSAHVEMVRGREPLPLLEQIEPSEMPAVLEKRWWHFFGLLNYERLEQERQASLRQWVERNDEPSHRKFRVLAEVCSGLRAGEQADEDDWG